MTAVPTTSHMLGCVTELLLPQNRMPVKTSVPSHRQTVTLAKQDLLTCAPHRCRSARPLLACSRAFPGNGAFVICTWAMCCPRDSRAKGKSLRLCDGTMRAQPRTEQCFSAPSRWTSPLALWLPTKGNVCQAGTVRERPQF